MVINKRWVVIAGLVVIAATGAFWRLGMSAAPVPTRPGTGHVGLEWRGRFLGRAIVPATLNWCPGTRLGILQGIARDTGVVIVFHEAAMLTRGPHPAVNPEQLSVPRPGATAALRWTRDSATIVGFRSHGGSVTIDSVGETASGRFDLRMQAPGSIDTLVLRGVFDHVPVTATAVGCS